MGSFGAKFTVMTRCTLDDRRFERDTLEQIKNRTRDGDLLLYIHSKGAVTEQHCAPESADLCGFAARVARPAAHLGDTSWRVARC